MPAVAIVAVAATLVVPLTGADARLEPVVLGAVASGLVALVGLAGSRRVLRGVIVLAALTAALALPYTPGGGHLHAADAGIAMSVAALGVVVLNGWGGQPFLAPLAVTGLCWRATTWMTGDLGQPAPVAVTAATALALVVGALLGLLCARLRDGVSIAVLSLGAAVALDAALPRDGVDGPALPTPATGYDTLLLLLGVCLAGVWAAGRGSLRLALIAGRRREDAAVARGVDLTAARVTASLICALLAGAAGCGLALTGASAPGFGALDSLRLVALVTLLGPSRPAAALLAGTICGVGALLAPGDRTAAVAGPAWFDLAVGAVLLLSTIARELRRHRSHKSRPPLIGPTAALLAGSVTPSRERRRSAERCPVTPNRATPSLGPMVADRVSHSHTAEVQPLVRGGRGAGSPTGDRGSGAQQEVIVSQA